jgi:hypothetical protein
MQYDCNLKYPLIYVISRCHIIHERWSEIYVESNSRPTYHAIRHRPTTKTKSDRTGNCGTNWVWVKNGVHINNPNTHVTNTMTIKIT